MGMVTTSESRAGHTKFIGYLLVSGVCSTSPGRALRSGKFTSVGARGTGDALTSASSQDAPKTSQFVERAEDHYHSFTVFCTKCPLSFFFFNDTATTEIYTLSLHDALPI